MVRSHMQRDKEKWKIIMRCKCNLFFSEIFSRCVNTSLSIYHSMSSEREVFVHRALEHLVCPTEGSIRVATTADAENLFHFINKAYYKDHSKYKRKEFENRLDSVDDIHSYMNKGVFLLLTASDHEQMKILNDGCSFVACIFLNHLDFGELATRTFNGTSSLKINLLAVHPVMLKRGVGRYMLDVVEVIAKTLHYTHVFLTAISYHTHLIDIYTKWDFKVIETKALVDCGMNPEKYNLSCYMIVMEKKLLWSMMHRELSEWIFQGWTRVLSKNLDVIYNKNKNFRKRR